MAHPDNFRRFKQATVAVAVLAVFPVCHAITPLLLRDALPLCPFRAITGKPCPLCGATRAIALATHGRFREAFGMNPAWPVFAGTMIGIAALLLGDALSGSRRSAVLSRAFTKSWGWMFAALCVFDIWRIALGR